MGKPEALASSSLPQRDYAVERRYMEDVAAYYRYLNRAAELRELEYLHGVWPQGTRQTYANRYTAEYNRALAKALSGR
ncbi:hypothetical protein [Bifidobacterium sp. UTBIF-68]|uniref:hypothetical protein n=1 Tax=Bifidobacterium sp. UTBIF-68 TaxID=1465262 RepID=UPI00112ECEE4|nr:hypothetical protein [Bifidobacterium sp. UTBIF-68]